MTPCDLELVLGGGGASAESPFSFELKTFGEKVNYCQSLPSDFLLHRAIGVPPKKLAEFGIYVIFCLAYWCVIIQRRSGPGFFVFYIP